LLEHPNVIWLNEIIDDPKKDKLYLVTEWYSKGSLGDLVASKNKKVGLAPSTARNYLVDMLKALHYCHNVVMAPAKVIHRDIKPDNIMINHNNDAILIDFGVSAIVDHQEDNTIGNNMGS
jgi:serine/threonine protein kinase